MMRPVIGTAESQDGRKADLQPGQCIALAIRSAFALPATGAFSDLLSAIDAASERGSACRKPADPVPK